MLQKSEKKTGIAAGFLIKPQVFPKPGIFQGSSVDELINLKIILTCVLAIKKTNSKL
jgi:hypothetical protein